jgi:uncharacterized repeat protein (TIGR04138 family)
MDDSDLPDHFSGFPPAPPARSESEIPVDSPMRNPEFDSQVRDLVRMDNRYQREAYFFLRDALSFAQSSSLSEDNESDETYVHVTGQNLLNSIRQFALHEYGPMAGFLLNQWGIHRCEDFGEIVYNLIDIGLFQKDENDRKEHFHNGYDFFEAFHKPFLPSPAYQKQFSRPLSPSIEKF